jgi:hypothetical protein
LTGLIVARIIQLRHQVKEMLGIEHCTLYTSLAMVTVESAIPVSCTGLAFIITYAAGSAAQNIFLSILPQLIVRLNLFFRPGQEPIINRCVNSALLQSSLCAASSRDALGPQRTRESPCLQYYTPQIQPQRVRVTTILCRLWNTPSFQTIVAYSVHNYERLRP